jgi:hypothetical protein
MLVEAVTATPDLSQRGGRIRIGEPMLFDSLTSIRSAMSTMSPTSLISRVAVSCFSAIWVQRLLAPSSRG